MSRSYRKEYVFRKHSSANGWRRRVIRSKVRASERKVLDIHSPEIWEEEDIQLPKESVGAWEWGDYKPFVIFNPTYIRYWKFPHKVSNILWNDTHNKWKHYKYQRPFNEKVQKEEHKYYNYYVVNMGVLDSQFTERYTEG